MTVCVLIISLTAIGCFISRSNRRLYYIFAACILGTLYVFYNPPEADDLYRYYRLFDIVKKYSFSELVNLDFSISEWLYDYMLRDYLQNSKVFVAILFLISRIGSRELVPVFFCIMTYIPLFMVVLKISEQNKLNSLATGIGYIVIMFCIDYRFVSMLRNISAYAMFFYFLYVDVIEKKRRIWCFVGYIILCQLHMACVILLAIRVVIFIFRDRFKLLISVVLLSLNLFLTLMIKIMIKYFGNITYIARLAKRISNYYYGRTNYNIHGALFFVACIFTTLVIYGLTSKKMKNKEYNCMYLYTTCFTIGSIYQYDVLLRNTEIIIILCLPYIMLFINTCISFDRGHLNIKGSSETSILSNWIGLMAIVCLAITSLVFYTLFSYTPMQRCFFWR